MCVKSSLYDEWVETTQCGEFLSGILLDYCTEIDGFLFDDGVNCSFSDFTLNTPLIELLSNP